MRTAFFLLAVAINSAYAVPSQATKDYLALRKRSAVRYAAGIEALETLVGARTLEIQALTSGTMGFNQQQYLLVEPSEGDPIEIRATNAPAWLTNPGTQARLLVQAVRPAENAALTVTLISAAPEADIAAFERAEAARETVLAPKPRTASPSPSPSRSFASPRTASLPVSEVTPLYASFIQRVNPRLGNQEAMRIAQSIVGFSLRYGVDARLIMAMVMTESGFKPGARSRVGAMGLGQLMPGTARWLGVSNAYDSVENLYGTVKLVRRHLQDYQRKTGREYEATVLTLAAYNAGPGAVRRHGGVPPYRETQNYVQKVIGLYRQLSGR